MSRRDTPTETRRIDYTTRHRRWEFEHKWGPGLSDVRKYSVSLRSDGKGIDIAGIGRESEFLPLPVADALTAALLEALAAAAEDQDS